jgi:hypothetical protein
LAVAVIVVVVAAATTLLVTVNVAVVEPLETVTLAGTVAAVVSLLDNVAVRCVVLPAAGAFSVTVAVELMTPPATLVGFRVTFAT